MRQQRLIKTKIFGRFIFCSGALLLASAVFSLAVHAKIWQYLSQKGPTAQFLFKATKANEDERPLVAEKFRAEDCVPSPLVDQSQVFVTPHQEGLPRSVSILLSVYSFRSPPA